MSAVLLIGPHQSAQQIRELLGAARLANALTLHVWCFGEPGGIQSLPADEVVFFPIKGPCLPNDLAQGLLPFLYRQAPGLVLSYGDAFGSDLIVRLSALMQKDCANAVTAITKTDRGFVARKLIYGLQVQAECYVEDQPAFFSIMPECFAGERGSGAPALAREALSAAPPWFSAFGETPLVKPENLFSGKVALIGGRGLGGSQTAQRLLYLGRLLGAGVGATRPAVYNGWFGHERLVGASGARIAPKHCIVFGASGCEPLLIGIRNSDCITAVNSDIDAPIFDHCDVGILADCNQLIEELIARYERSSHS